MAERRLDIIVAAKNLASGALAGIRNELLSFAGGNGTKAAAFGAVTLGAFKLATHEITNFADAVSKAAQEVQGGDIKLRDFAAQTVRQVPVLGQTVSMWDSIGEAIGDSSAAAVEFAASMMKGSDNWLSFEEVFGDPQKIIESLRSGRAEIEANNALVEEATKKQQELQRVSEAKEKLGRMEEELRLQAQLADGATLQLRREAELALETRSHAEELRKLASASHDAAAADRVRTQQRAALVREQQREIQERVQRAQEGEAALKFRAAGMDLEAELVQIRNSYAAKIREAKSFAEAESLASQAGFEAQIAVKRKGGAQRVSGGVSGGAETSDVTTRFVGLAESFRFVPEFRQTAEATEESARLLEEIADLMKELRDSAVASVGGIPLGGG